MLQRHLRWQPSKGGREIRHPIRSSDGGFLQEVPVDGALAVACRLPWPARRFPARHSPNGAAARRERPAAGASSSCGCDPSEGPRPVVRAVRLEAVHEEQAAGARREKRAPASSVRSAGLQRRRRLSSAAPARPGSSAPGDCPCRWPCPPVGTGRCPGRSTKSDLIIGRRTLCNKTLRKRSCSPFLDEDRVGNRSRDVGGARKKAFHARGKLSRRREARRVRVARVRRHGPTGRPSPLGSAGTSFPRTVQCRS